MSLPQRYSLNALVRVLLVEKLLNEVGKVLGGKRRASCTDHCNKLRGPFACFFVVAETDLVFPSC